MGISLKYEDVKMFVSENSDCVLVSDTYKNNTSKLVFLCKCGTSFETSFKSFKIANKRQCKECGIEIRTAKLRKDNTKQCLNCNNDFKPVNKTRKFCTYECSCEYKRNNNFKICVICGNNHKGEKLCCSPRCGYELLRKNNKEKLEKRLGIDSLEEYLKKLYLIENKTTREISNIIYGKYTNNGTVSKLLKENNIEVRQGSEAMQSQWINATGRRKTSSDRLVKRLGIKPRLKDSIPIQELRKTSEYKEWRLRVYWKANFTCECCGTKRSKTVKMNAHHLNSFQLNKEQRYEVDNGVCLCERCHWDFHGKYGNVDNKVEQFYEFKENRIRINNN